MACVVVVGRACGPIDTVASSLSNPPKSFSFYLRGSGGSFDVPSRSAVEQRLRDEFLLENPYADRFNVEAHVRTETDSALQLELDRRDRLLDSKLQRARSDFLNTKSLR